MKNKFGWDKKDFESCLEKVSYPNKIKSNNYLQEGRFPIVSQDENLVCGFWDDESDVLKIQDSVVVFGDHTRALKYVDFDFVVGADGVRVLLPKSFMKSKFLYYYLKWVNVPSLGYSRHYKLLKELNLPVPPLPTQHQIVSELDALSEIISKKKLQLEELDKLAQATFYDMFGDPVTNEKGWEVRKLKEICTKITDGTHDTPQRLLEGVKFITGKHIRPNIIDYDNSDYVTEDVHIEIFKRCNPEFGDILYTNIGVNLGTAAINTVHYEFSMKNVALFKLKFAILNGYYLEYYLNNGDVRNNILVNFASGGAQKFLSLTSIKQIRIPVPNISIQKEFASKIESIESQKSLITQSIAEVQQLFDYTMDKYFN